MTNVSAQVKTEGLNIMDRLLSSIAKSTTLIAKNLKAMNAEGRTGAGAWAGFLAGASGGRVGVGSNTMTWQGSVPALKPSGPSSQTGAPTTMPWSGKLPTLTPGGPTSTTGSYSPPGGGQGGAPPGGGPSNSMPWMGAVNRGGAMAYGALAAAPAAMLAAAPLANMLSGRIGQQITEGAPIAAMSLRTSSMYSGMQYNRVERERFRQLGQFAGSRQDVAAAGEMALRLGQTPQQAGRYLQGVGNTVQAMGGTMTAPQVIQATGGFQDSLVMRRQIASGMRPARIGGQVRDPREVSRDYINNFEQKFNGGRKLNEYDFINLQTPGSGLRIRFQRLYGLDDSAIDMLTVAGMQSLKAGNSLSTSGQLTAAGMSSERISLAVSSLSTTKGLRNANFMARTEGGMVNQLQTEETIQRALGGLEEATSGLISEFAGLERVVKGVTTALGVIAGMGLLKGALGGGGGGIGIPGLGGGVGFGGFARTAAGGVGTGAPAAAAAAAPAAGAAGGVMSGMASRAGLAPVGVGFGIAAAKTAANATNWGDLFTSAGEGVASGAALGGMVGGPWGAAIGAVGGGVLAFGAAGFNWLTDTSGRDQETARQSTSASNMTDKEILDKFITNRNAVTSRRTPEEIRRMNETLQYQINPETNEPYGPNFLTADTAEYLTKSWTEVGTDAADEESTGFMDRFQIRRSALIEQWMNEAVNTGQPFQDYMKWLTQRWNGRDPTKPVSDADVNKTLDEWIRVQDKFHEFASSSGEVEDSDYEDAGTTLLNLTQAMRSPGNTRHAPGWAELNEAYKNYFGDYVRHPMEYKPVYTDAAIGIIGQYQFTASDYVQSRLAGSSQTGDPNFGDGNDHGGLTPTEPFNFGSIASLRLAPEPDDPNWNKMDKRMQQRLRIMFANSGGQVRWEKGGGWRSTERQRQMFLERYRPDPNGSITWNGQKWKHVSGAAAAPPGRSYHEIGLAADLGGPGVGNGWLKKNARRFGLKEFSSVNDEPWHVQLIELPNGRSSYDQGADTGAAGASVTDTVPAESGPVSGAVSGGGASGIGGGSSAGLLTMNTSSLAALSGGAGGGGGGGGGNYEGTAGATTADTTTDYSGSGPLTGEQIAKMAYAAGFRGDNLITILGIAKRESNWDPAAHNTNANTGDNSYGLTQINMLGSLGPARQAQFGISKYDELLNPATNLKAAFTMSGGSNFHAWLGYRAGLSISDSQHNAAVQAVKDAHLGDAVFDTGQGGNMTPARQAMPTSLFGSMVASTGSNGGGAGGINVNVTIQSSGNYGYDAQRLARAVRPAFEAEYAEVSAKRSS